jgi:2-amino-4-hydroxy-6-hydroxymethyldihydropteridine diphosphokinase
MILVALGSNLTTEPFESSEDLLEDVVKSFKSIDIIVISRSSWYCSAPVPAADQPWFVNGVVQIATAHPPEVLLAALHRVEAKYDRRRTVRNASRTLDLDLLDYDGIVRSDGSGLVLPHPRLAQRAFVVVPLLEVAPAWRHPVTGLTPAEMLAKLPSGQQIERLT